MELVGYASLHLADVVGGRVTVHYDDMSINDTGMTDNSVTIQGT